MLFSRFVGASIAPLAIAGATLGSLNAMAHDEHADAAPMAANQVVVRDAATGALRAPTEDEMKALHAATPAAPASRLRAAAPARASEPLHKIHSGGARGARLTTDFASYNVAVRQADGSFAMQCFDSREAAEAALKPSPASKNASVVEKE